MYMKGLHKCYFCYSTIDFEGVAQPIGPHDNNPSFNYDTGEVIVNCYCDNCGRHFKRVVQFTYEVTGQYDYIEDE